MFKLIASTQSIYREVYGAAYEVRRKIALPRYIKKWIENRLLTSQSFICKKQQFQNNYLRICTLRICVSLSSSPTYINYFLPD